MAYNIMYCLKILFLFCKNKKLSKEGAKGTGIIILMEGNSMLFLHVLPMMYLSTTSTKGFTNVVGTISIWNVGHAGIYGWESNM